MDRTSSRGWARAAPKRPLSFCQLISPPLALPSLGGSNTIIVASQGRAHPHHGKTRCTTQAVRNSRQVDDREFSADPYLFQILVAPVRWSASPNREPRAVVLQPQPCMTRCTEAAQEAVRSSNQLPVSTHCSELQRCPECERTNAVREGDEEPVAVK